MSLSYHHFSFIKACLDIQNTAIASLCAANVFERMPSVQRMLKPARFFERAIDGGIHHHMVPKVGLEPTRYRYQRILSPSRLPIPSLRRMNIISHEFFEVNRNCGRKMKGDACKGQNGVEGGGQISGYKKSLSSARDRD